VSSLLALVVLPALQMGYHAAWITVIILIILVPRDTALVLAQGESRLISALFIDGAYFLGSMAGFVIAASYGLLHTAEDVLTVNLIAALLSALISVLCYPVIMKPKFHGNWRGVISMGKWTGGLSIGELYLQQGDLLVLGAMVEPVKLGPYVAAKTLLRVYALLSQAVNFLVVPSASRHAMEGSLDRLRKKLRGALSLIWLILIPMNVALFMTADYLLPGVLGEKYRDAVPYFQILMLATFFEPLYSVTANALVGIGRPKTAAIIFWIVMVFNISANIVLVLNYDMPPAPWILVSTYITLGIGLYLHAHRELRS
jgi:O-antigen/teichoic acid export membrane protein